MRDIGWDYRELGVLILLDLSLDCVEKPGCRDNLNDYPKRICTSSSNIRKTSSQKSITVLIFDTSLLSTSVGVRSTFSRFSGFCFSESTVDRFLPHTTSAMGWSVCDEEYGNEMDMGRSREAANYTTASTSYLSFLGL